jgi:hypothetical protein
MAHSAFRGYSAAMNRGPFAHAGGRTLTLQFSHAGTPDSTDPLLYPSYLLFVSFGLDGFGKFMAVSQFQAQVQVRFS